MIEYANEAVTKLLKQYDMLAKSLSFTMDIRNKNDICEQMTKIIQNVIEMTNSIYEDKFNHIKNKHVNLMDEERTRLLELINIVNERRAYVNNQVISNKELTGISLDMGFILGESELDEYKSRVKIIDKYKSNVRLEMVLKEELQVIDSSIRKANNKIRNNQNLNKQLEERAIKLLDEAFKKLSLFELQDREKEIDLAYTELGYSLEKAKENAVVARRNCAEEIILECDNMLASITLEYERYKEKKLILKLIRIYQKKVTNYEELLAKREEINSIMMGITSSELYSLVGVELNKEYATIKLEGQDVATLKSLMEERDLKTQSLKEVVQENDSKEFKDLLADLLENEKRYQEKLQLEKKKAEQRKLELRKMEEQHRKEEIAKRQKAIEEERKKEIELRTKQLLVEKKNPVLMPGREERGKEEVLNKKELGDYSNKFGKGNENLFSGKNEKKNQEFKKDNVVWKSKSAAEIFPSRVKNNIFDEKSKRSKVVDKGVPVIENDRLSNQVLKAEKENNDKKVFPEVPLDKKESIFPSLTDKNNSFFDDDELDDLSNYMEDSNKKSWF